VNKVTADKNIDVKKVEPIALLDCGQATQVTKGVPFMLYYEVCPPPYDRAMIWM
jgi:hypothetical protein